MSFSREATFVLKINYYASDDQYDKGVSDQEMLKLDEEMLNNMARSFILTQLAQEFDVYNHSVAIVMK